VSVGQNCSCELEARYNISSMNRDRPIVSRGQAHLPMSERRFTLKCYDRQRKTNGERTFFDPHFLCFCVSDQKHSGSAKARRLVIMCLVIILMIGVLFGAMAYVMRSRSNSNLQNMIRVTQSPFIFVGKTKLRRRQGVRSVTRSSRWTAPHSSGAPKARFAHSLSAKSTVMSRKSSTGMTWMSMEEYLETPSQQSSSWIDQFLALFTSILTKRNPTTARKSATN